MKSKEPRFEMNHRNRLFTLAEKYEAKSEPIHWHENYLIEFVTGGEGIHRLNNIPYDYKRGSAYVLRLRDFHELEIKEPTTVHRLVLPVKCMPERFVRSMLRNKSNLITVLSEDMITHIENLLLLLESRKRAENQDELFIQDCLLNVIIMLFTNSVNTNPGHRNRHENLKAHDIWLYIEDNFRKKLTLQSVAEHFDMNPNYLNRIFKEYTGVTLYAAVKKFRLRYAAKLCRETDMQSNEICETCGYSGTANFQRDFKKEYGATPRQYREAAKAGVFNDHDFGPQIERLGKEKTKENE